MFGDFNELDWKPLLGTIDALDRERDAPAVSSDVLRTLQQQFSELSAAQAATAEEFDSAISGQARLGEKREQAQLAHADCALLLEATPANAQALYFPLLDSLRAQAFGAQALTVESCENREKDLRELIQTNIDAEDKKIARLRDAIIGAMQDYTRAWPLDAREVDVSIEAAAEFEGMLNVLQADDLPRFAGRFKELLNENTIRQIAGFQSQLKRERETIRERIETINGSLHAIDYNPNRYIALEAEANLDADLRDFQQDLRTCTEGALTGSADEEYSEAKFLQVKRIIERFRGREGSAEMDRRWTRKRRCSRWCCRCASRPWPSWASASARSRVDTRPGGGRSAARL